MAYIPSNSRELLYVKNLTAFDADSSDAADPTALPVQVAFMATGEPDTADWHDAEWASATSVRILVGPSAVELEEGRYAVWLRVTGATEQPERNVGKLVVT